MGRNICSTEGTSCVELETSSTSQCCRSPWRRTYNLHFTKPTQALATLQICVLIPMDNHSLPPSSRKPFFSRIEAITGKPQVIKTQSCRAHSNGHIYSITPPPHTAKAEGLLQKRGQKECKSQRSAETRREGLPQRSTHQLVNTKRSVSIENIRARNTRTYIRIEVHT